MKARWTNAVASKVSCELLSELGTVCERLIIAGSIRRQCATVGDVEILYVPIFSSRKADLLSNELVNEVDGKLDHLLKYGVIQKRNNVRGHQTWGPKNKLAVHIRTTIPVDFFETTEDNWWVSLVIRTGGKHTNLGLTTGANKLGRTLNAYGCGVTDRMTGEVTRATSERHVFELCGVPYAEPKDRI